MAGARLPAARVYVKESVDIQKRYHVQSAGQGVLTRREGDGGKEPIRSSNPSGRGAQPKQERTINSHISIRTKISTSQEGKDNCRKLTGLLLLDRFRQKGVTGERGGTEIKQGEQRRVEKFSTVGRKCVSGGGSERIIGCGSLERTKNQGAMKH